MKFRPFAPPFSRRGLLGAGAASLIAPGAYAQSALGGGASATANNGPAIVVTPGGNAPTPIAIPVFTDGSGGQSDLGGQISGVLSDDLGHSGLFAPIDPSSFVPNSINNGTPVWQNWAILNAQYLVTGDVADQGNGQVRVEFRLWNVQTQTQVQGTAYTTTSDNWRRIGHIIGDVVYQQVIGEKGYFDSRVAYISESGPVTSPIRRLAVMDYDGENNQFLTDGSSMALSPEYNPTRQQLAFVSFQDNNPRVYLFDLQTGAQQEIGSYGEMTIWAEILAGWQFAADVGQPKWRLLDRARRAWRGRHDAADGCFLHQRHALLLAGWQPDRLQLGPRRQPAALCDECRWLGREAHQLRPGALCGAELVTARRPYCLYILGLGGFSIGVMAPDGSGERILSQGFLVESASFCPNGRVIMFYRQTPTEDGHSSRLVTIGVDGFNERLVDTPSDASDPSWGPLLA